MKVTMITILLLPFLLVSTEQVLENNKIIENSILEVIKKFYKTQTSTVNFLLLINDENLKFKVDKIVNELLKSVEFETTITVENNENKNINVKKFCVIFVDSFESFNQIDVNLHFYFSGFYTIILMSKHKETELKKIFELFLTHQIVNVNILQSENSGVVNFYTFHPYTSKHCNEVEIFKINSFDGKLKSSQIFSDKMKNLNKCKIKVAVVESPPYVLQRFNFSKSIDTLYGLDLYMILVHADQMNFSLKILHFNVANKSKSLPDANGVALHNLVERKVNFSTGLMFQSEVKNNLATSGFIYHTTKVVWVIPPGQPLTAREIFTRPFQKSLWIFSFIVYMLTRIVIVVISTKGSKKVKNFVFGRNIRDPYLNFLRIIIGISLPKLPVRNFARFILILYVLFYLVLRTAYQGKVYHFMKIERQVRQVKGMREMLDENFTFYALDTFVGVITSPKVKKRTTFLSIQDFNKFPFDNLTHMDKVALLATEDHVAYWNKIGQPDYFFSVCPEIYKTVNLAIYFNKNSSLKHTSDEIVMKMIDKGFIELFRRQTIDYSFLKRKHFYKEPKKLRLEQFFGIFYFYVFAIILSSFVFICELLYGKLQRFCFQHFSKLLFMRGNKRKIREKITRK